MLLELDVYAGSPRATKPPRVVRLPMSWRVMRRVRAIVDRVLEDQPATLRQSARLVASELIENVIKYGHAMPDGTRATITISLSDGVLSISSRNGVSSDHHVPRVFEIVNRLKTGDTQSVYIEAILHAMAVKRKNASMGLIRIAAEAAFDLDARYAEGELELIARKGIPS
jgi:hypothetical protein